MILFPVTFIFSLIQTATTTTSENLTQLDLSKLTHLLPILYDCSKQYNLRQFSLTRVQKLTQAPLKFNKAKQWLPNLFVLKRKK